MEPWEVCVQKTETSEQVQPCFVVGDRSEQVAIQFRDGPFPPCLEHPSDISIWFAAILAWNLLPKLDTYCNLTFF